MNLQFRADIGLNILIDTHVKEEKVDCYNRLSTIPATESLLANNINFKRQNELLHQATPKKH
jgi:hypothetical protein